MSKIVKKNFMYVAIMMMMVVAIQANRTSAVVGYEQVQIVTNSTNYVTMNGSMKVSYVKKNM